MPDGSIVIDTTIDTQGASAGYNKLVAEIKKLNRDLEILNKNSKLSNLEQQLATLYEKTQKYNEKLEELQATKKHLEAKAELINSDSTQKELVKVSEEIKRTENTLSKYGDKYTQVENNINFQTAQEAAKRATINDKLTITRQKISEMVAAQNSVPPATDRMTAAMEKFETRIAGLAKRVLILSVITAALNLLKKYIGSALKTVEPFTQAVGRLKGALLTAFQPIWQVIIPIITAFTNALAMVVGWLARLINALMGKSAPACAKNAKALNSQAEALDGVSSSAKEAEKSMADFDTINALSSNSSASSGSDSSIGTDFSEMEKASKWTEKFERAMAAVKKILDVVRPVFQKFNEDVLKPFLELCRKTADVVSEFLVKALESFANWVVEHQDEIQQFIEILLTIGLVAGVVALLTMGITKLYGALLFLKGIIPGLLGSWAMLLLALAAIVVWAGNSEDAIQMLKDMLFYLSEFITDVFTGDWDRAWKSLANIAIAAFNLVILAVGSFVKLLISAFNWLGEQLTRYTTITVPDWIPGLEGKIFSLGWSAMPTDFEIQQIPYLAKGAIIPPNAPFMAMLGDQKNGTNIETPLETMVEAFRQAQGNQTINIKFTGSLAQLGRCLKPVIDKENTRVGTSLVKKGV